MGGTVPDGKRRGKRGFNREEILKGWERGGKLPLARALRCRVRDFTDGVAQGCPERLLCRPVRCKLVPVQPSLTSFDRDQWYAALGRRADALGEGPEVRLCLISRYHPDEVLIRQLISGLSPRNREQAAENLIYLIYLTAIQP